jgi:hypothetical protein
MVHDGLNSAHWSRDETWILSWAFGKTIKQWDADTGLEIGPEIVQRFRTIENMFPQPKVDPNRPTYLESARLGVLMPGDPGDEQLPDDRQNNGA